jgi:hypothetical protein
MIINLLINMVVSVISAIMSFLPKVTLASIPWAGNAISVSLTTMIQLWNSFMVTFPYAVYVWHAFLWVILPFEALMLLGKFLLGHRMPANN